MPIIKVQAVVPGLPDQVFEYVTGFSATGGVNRRALEEKHGRLIEQEGNTYTFQDNTDDETVWNCTFDPPDQRVMRAQESRWADRIDLFQASPDGTLWTVVWEPKVQGFRAYTQWLMFHIRGKSRVYQSIIMPVVLHFQEGPSRRLRRSTTRSARRKAKPKDSYGEIGAGDEIRTHDPNLGNGQHHVK